MKKFFLIIFIPFIFGINLSKLSAQKIGPSDYNTISAGIKFGFIPFYGDVRQLKYSTDNQYKKANSGFAFEVSKNFNHIIGVRGNVLLGGLSGSTPNLNLHFNSKFSEYSVSALVNINNLISLYPKKEKLINTYLFLGTGWVRYRSRVYSFDEDNYVIGYGWDSLGTTKEKKMTNMVFPVGVGVKFKADPKIDIGMEFTLHLTTTDKLDAWKVEDSYNDRYSYIAISFLYKIGEKKEYVDWVNPVMDTTALIAEKSNKEKGKIKVTEEKKNIAENKKENVIESKEIKVVEEKKIEKKNIENEKVIAEKKQKKEAEKKNENVQDEKTPEIKTSEKPVTANVDTIKKEELKKEKNKVADIKKQENVVAEKSKEEIKNENIKTEPEKKNENKTGVKTQENPKKEKVAENKKVETTVLKETKAKENKKSKTNVVEEKDYYIVVSSHKTKKLAQETIDKLVEKGYTDAQILGKNSSGMWRVSIKGYDDFESAVADYKIIKKSYTSSKLLQKKGDFFTDFTSKAKAKTQPSQPKTTDTTRTKPVAETTKPTTVIQPKTEQPKVNNEKPVTNVVKTDTVTKQAAAAKPVNTTQPTTVPPKTVQPITKPVTNVVKSDTVAKQAATAKPVTTTQPTTVPPKTVQPITKPVTNVVKTDTVAKQAATAKPVTTTQPTTVPPKIEQPKIEQPKVSTEKPVVSEQPKVEQLQTEQPATAVIKKDTAVMQKDTVKIIEKNIFVIAASYPTEQEAKDAAIALTQKGFKDAGVAGKNEKGEFLVYYKVFDSMDAALTQLKVIQRMLNPSAWIYEKK